MWVHMTWSVVLLALVGLSQGRQRLDPLVQTSQGLIRGQRAEQGDYYMFLGIPYARVDEDSPFGVSSPYPKFDDIYNADDDSSICPQVSDDNDVIGTLDCLRLNIYVASTVNTTTEASG